MNEVQALAESLQLTVAEARSLINAEPAGWSGQQQRNAAAWLNRYVTSVAMRQRQQYSAALETIHEKQADIEVRLEEAEKRLAGVGQAVKTGRMTDEEGAQAVAVIVRDINDYRAVLDGLDRSVERALEVVNTDPADFQTASIARFPSLANSLPIFSLDVLNGHGEDLG